MPGDTDRELGALNERTVNLQKSFEKFAAAQDHFTEIVHNLTERVDGRPCPRTTDIDNIAKVVQSNTTQISKNGQIITRVEKAIESNVNATQKNTEFRTSYKSSASLVGKMGKVLEKVTIIILMIITIIMGKFMCSYNDGNFVEKVHSSDNIEKPEITDE